MRHGVFAGTWYPDDFSTTKRTLREFETLVPPTRQASEASTVILPHAGWFFSGPTAWATLRSISDAWSPEIVLLFGGHLGPASQPTVAKTDGWILGSLKLESDRELIESLSDSSELNTDSDSRFRPDNGIELALSVLGQRFPNARYVCIGIPPSRDALSLGKKIGTLARTLHPSAEILTAGSTDLTHYGPSYGFAPKGIGAQAEEWVKTENDPSFLQPLLSGQLLKALDAAVQRGAACCPGAAVAALEAARAVEENPEPSHQKNRKQDSDSSKPEGRIIDYRTSLWRKEGRTNDFVGYAGILF